MTITRTVLAFALTMAAAASAEQSPGIVRNGEFEVGGRMVFGSWRPVRGPVQCLRAGEEGARYLQMRLRDDGDGGLTQLVDLPPRRSLSLRVLATAWDIAEGGVIADLVREADGQVLAEVTVGRIVRGMMGCNFETGPGGPAWLTVRLRGPRGGTGAVEWVQIGPPLAAAELREPAYGLPGADLVLRAGQGLAMDLPEGELLARGAEMVREALAELMPGTRPQPGAVLKITVEQPPAQDWPAQESYRLVVQAGGVHIHGGSEQGALWGMMTLVDLMRAEPGGGVRIRSAQVEDAPDLPWRVGWSEGLAGDALSIVNAAKKLVRLKMNMVIIAAGTPAPSPADWDLRGHTASALVRQWGLEPIAALSSCLDPSAETLEAAARAAIEQLGARYLMVDLCCGAWDGSLAQRMVALAESCDPPVTLLSRLGGPEGPAAQTRLVVSEWPRAIVMVCGRECLESAELGGALRAVAGRGVPYLLEADGGAADLARAALAARQRGEQCLGVAGWGGDLEEAANGGWRVPR